MEGVNTKAGRQTMRERSRWSDSEWQKRTRQRSRTDEGEAHEQLLGAETRSQPNTGYDPG